MSVLAMYVVYDHPLDHPDGYVCRRWMVGKRGLVPDKEVFMKAQDLEVIRSRMASLGLTNLHRHVDEEPVVIETWV